MRLSAQGSASREPQAASGINLAFSVFLFRMSG